MNLCNSKKPSSDGFLLHSGGEGGIRTPDTVARIPDFESGAFNHSATSPCRFDGRDYSRIRGCPMGVFGRSARVAYNNGSHLDS